MTPDERAAAVQIYVGCGCCFDEPRHRDENSAEIATAIVAAIAEEREACAAAVLGLTRFDADGITPYEGRNPVLHEAAAAIWARSCRVA